MNNNMYIEDLYNRYCLYYNVERDVNLLNENIAIFAKFKNIMGRTFLTMGDVIDTFETNEFCFVKCIDNINNESFLNFTEYLKNAASKYVEPKEGHMCTHITGVIITNDEVNEKLKKSIEKFKFSKSFLFSFHGWYEIRILLINPNNRIIITNKAGKKVLKFYDFKDL